MSHSCTPIREQYQYVSHGPGSVRLCFPYIQWRLQDLLTLGGHLQGGGGAMAFMIPYNKTVVNGSMAVVKVVL